MTRSDWLGGLAFAAFLSPLIGMLGALIASINDVEKGNYFADDDSLITSRDVRRCGIISAVCLVVLTPLLGRLAKQDRVDVDSWARYKVEQQCQFTGQKRTHTEYHRIYLITTTEIITEYEWRCRGGDVYWKR